MNLYKYSEMDRPTFESLQFLTRVKPHHIVKEPLYVDHFIRAMFYELYGLDLLKEFEGTTRSHYSLEGHYQNQWNFDKAITLKPSDAILDEAIRIASEAFRLSRPVKSISWDNLASVPLITTSGAGYGYRGKKNAPGNHERAIRLAVAHLNAFKEEETGVKPRDEFRFTPDLAWTRISLGTFKRSGWPSG